MRGVQGKFGGGEWRSVVFGDFAEVQPKITLEKGAAYSFIEMAEVEPHTKSVHSNNTRIWNGNGGAKFEDGDVIFARITPCLEHGKTAKVNDVELEDINAKAVKLAVTIRKNFGGLAV